MHFQSSILIGPRICACVARCPGCAEHNDKWFARMNSLLPTTPQSRRAIYEKLTWKLEKPRIRVKAPSRPVSERAP